MNYNFDEIIDRTATDAIKVDGMPDIWGRKDLIPLWVADMEFRTPSCVMECIRKRCENEILGYTHRPDLWYETIIDWTRKRTGYEVKREEILYTPGIVPGLGFAVLSLTEPGDRILIQPPVYHPFSAVIKNNNRIPVTNPLILRDGVYHFDRIHFREAIKGCKLFILCNPHNPGGKVWLREELEYIADVCSEEGVIVISDEIHTDLTFKPYQSYLFASVSEKARNNCVVFRSSSKAFNMPGMASSYCFVTNKVIRKRLNDYIEGNELNGGHVFAYNTVIAAYQHGESWLEQVLDYIRANMFWLDEQLKRRMPRIKAILPQASYLVFLDCRALDMEQTDLTGFFANEAGLALNDGAIFGKEGAGFMRMNVACPRKILEKALDQLEKAYQERFLHQ